MRRFLAWAACIALCGGGVAGVYAQTEVFIYPEKGQSQEQTEKDKFECYGWAKGQSGFDPMAPPTASEPPPQAQAQGSTAGGAVKGAAGGALLGAGIGAIAGGKSGAKKGAGIGALSGGVVGGVRRSNQVRQDEAARQQWEQQQTSQYMQGRNQYNRAFAACMEGRGYTVK